MGMGDGDGGWDGMGWGCWDMGGVGEEGGCGGGGLLGKWEGDVGRRRRMGIVGWNGSRVVDRNPTIVRASLHHAHRTISDLRRFLMYAIPVLSLLKYGSCLLRYPIGSYLHSPLIFRRC